jgi:hypothetical protein
MELKEAIEKYKGLTIYTSINKYFQEGYRQQEFFDKSGISVDCNEPDALYLSEFSGDSVYLLYKYTKEMEEQLHKLKATKTT